MENGIIKLIKIPLRYIGDLTNIHSEMVRTMSIRLFHKPWI